MQKRPYILLIFLFSSVVMLGQTFVPKTINSDISGAIEVKDTLVYAKTSATGPGNRIEIQSETEGSILFEKEHHTVWYRINVQKTGELSFTIEALNNNDDHDFILYQVNTYDERFDRLLVAGMLKPTRSNLARNNSKIGSTTGLKTDSDINYQPEGVGNPFCKSLEVKKGQVLILVVDNVYKNGGGHKIHFSYKNCLEENPYKFQLHINVFDKETKQNIDSDIQVRIRSKEKRDTSNFSSVKSVVVGVDSLDEIEIIVSFVGYLTQIVNMKIYGRKSTKYIDVFLQAVYVGKVIEIEDVYFLSGKDRIRPESKRALRELLSIMKLNPSLRIEIQGHVNQPVNSKKTKSEAYYLELSELRALAVYKYLLDRGISKDRLSYKGFGYTKMIYPYAKRESEMEKNRRVEIEIIEVE